MYFIQNTFQYFSISDVLNRGCRSTYARHCNYLLYMTRFRNPHLDEFCPALLSRYGILDTQTNPYRISARLRSTYPCTASHVRKCNIAWLNRLSLRKPGTPQTFPESPFQNPHINVTGPSMRTTSFYLTASNLKYSMGQS